MLLSARNPKKIQEFLDKLPFNFEKRGETYRSPLKILENKEAHCFEGALLALSVLHQNGKKAFLLDLKTKDLKKDSDHVVTLFKEGRRWGAISKTNHSVLRWRDPIYKTPEALAFSYFHEYFLDSGEKSLLSYSEPFDVIKRFGTGWIDSDDDLDKIALALDKSKHFLFYPKSLQKFLRKASPLEIKAASREQYKSS